jgi:hypothetical protein
MKRLLFIFLFLFIFAGCTNTEENMDRAIAFRQMLLKCNGCQIECELTADYGDILYQFSLNCESDNRGNVLFTVSAPESIAGITGSISSSGGNIKFDDTLLGFPILSEDLPTPLSAPWLFITGLRSGYIRASNIDDGKLIMTIADTYEEDPIIMNIHFDKQECPAFCEFIWNGRRILSMEINSFTYL